MRLRESSPFRKIFLWVVIAIYFVIAGYLVLIFALSIFIGLKTAPQPGFWVPILVGTICLIPVLWAVTRLTKRILSRMAKKDIIRASFKTFNFVQGQGRREF